MTQSKSLLLVVIYDGSEQFFPNYFDSIESQDTRCFDLLVLHHSSTQKMIPRIGINVIDRQLPVSYTVSEVRKYGISYAIDNEYDCLIFSDIDDFFSPNRVSSSINGLQNHNFVFNQLSLVDSRGKIFSRNVLSGIIASKKLSSYEDIIDRNYLGLTHTAVDVKSLKYLEIPKTAITVDWWLYSVILLNGGEGIFLPDATTYYRQYKDNMSGWGKSLNEESLRRAVQIKTEHYREMNTYCIKRGLPIAAKKYKGRLNDCNSLAQQLNDRHYRICYIDTINRNIEEIYKGWWSEVRQPEEVTKYDS
jgi:hypothetical protein